MKIQLWLYRIVKPLFTKLELVYQRELRRIAALKNLELALKKLAQYRDRKTPELVMALRKQPPIGGCSHLKGQGRYLGPNSEFKSKWLMKDYNVSGHIYPNGKFRIRCNRCGEFKWQGEPGFEVFLDMLEKSTNCPSSSSVILLK